MRIHDIEIAFWNLRMNYYEAFACSFVGANFFWCKWRNYGNQRRWLDAQGPEEFETLKFSQFAN